MGSGYNKTLELSKYDFVAFDTSGFGFLIVPVGTTDTAYCETNPYFLTRQFSATTTGVSISIGHAYGTYGNWGYTDNQDYGFLRQIYGIKVNVG